MIDIEQIMGKVHIPTSLLHYLWSNNSISIEWSSTVQFYFQKNPSKDQTNEKKDLSSFEWIVMKIWIVRRPLFTSQHDATLIN